MPNGEYNIKVKSYISEGSLIEGEVEISVYDIAKHMTEEQLADFLADYENKYSNEYAEGQRIGGLLQHSHRTFQGSVARLLLGILVGIGDTQYFDARNEKAVALGKKLKVMIESGELNFGYMI